MNTIRPSLVVLVGLLVPLFGRSAGAQTPQPGSSGSVRIIVRDATGLSIAGATVTLSPPDGQAATLTTSDGGETVFERVAAGTYVAHIESAGFAPLDHPNIIVRDGRRTNIAVEAQIATIEAQVEVIPEQGDEAFTSGLTAEQIEALPDDPTELAQLLEQLVGSDLDIRVNGFSGGELPRGGQIQEVRIRWDAASANGRGDGPRVEIRTQPGGDRWRNRVSFGLRDERFNARHAYATLRPSGQTRQYGWTMSGPIVRNRTGVSLSIDRSETFEQQAVRAARADGLFSALVPQPATWTGLALDIEHAINPAHQLRGEVRINGNDQRNLGVSEFDLPQRAYSRDDADGRFRLGHRGTFRQQYVNDLRLQFRWQRRDSQPLTDLTAIRVLDAFTAGGAQIQGGSRSREVEIEDELEFTLGGAHQISTGFTINRTTHRSDEQRNAGGTFTFATLEAFEAGAPMTFTQRVGDPLIEYSIAQFGWHLQDDYRVHRTLIVNLGMRHDFQTHLSDWSNFSPRLGLNWTPFGARRMAVRVSAGQFYRPFGASLYEQTLRLNGHQQRDLVIANPGYPDPFFRGEPRAQRPPSFIRIEPSLVMPSVWRLSVGVDQPLAPWARIRTTYSRRSSHDLFRSRDVNAPIDGRRPDPSVGSITQLESTGRSLNQSLETQLSVTYEPTLLSGSVAYTLGEAMDDSDGALNLPPNSFDLSNEWGPARQDIRHRFQASINTNLWAAFWVDASFRAQSAAPYTIVTGLDANGDGEPNERPIGIGRNSERGAASTNLDMILTWGRGFGQRTAGAMAGTPEAPRAGGGRTGRRRGGGRNTPTELIRLEIFARATNVLNAVNPQRFSGVLNSPFFGLPISAVAARRVNLGMRVLF